jgi:hypothetical protein
MDVKTKKGFINVTAYIADFARAALNLQVVVK